MSTPYQLEQMGAIVTATIRSAELTGLTAQELMIDLSDRLRNDNARHFIFDLSEVEYMDSACIGALVEFLQDIEPMHGRIALACCSPNVEFLFKVTRLDNVFPIYEDVEDANIELSKAA